MILRVTTELDGHLFCDIVTILKAAKAFRMEDLCDYMM